MVHYSVSFSGTKCTINKMKLEKDEPFVLHKLPHNESITHLVITECTIPCLSEDIIGSFSNIEIIEAIDVNIEEISEDAFVDCPKLKHIDLRKNNIKEVAMNTFNRNRSLEFLYLGENQLETLPEEIFLDLENLQILDLSSNNLKKLSKRLFKNMKNLKFLSVSHNPMFDVKVEALSAMMPKLREIAVRDMDFGAERLQEILKFFKENEITCILDTATIRERDYSTRLIEGVECISDAEYERLASIKKTSKLEKILEDMRRKIEIMEQSLAFLLKDHEVRSNKEKTLNILRAEDLEKEFQMMMKEAEKFKC